MGIFAVWREKFGFIRFLVDAQKTPWYPALFAALCVIAGTNNHTVYIPILCILACFVLFSVFFADDNKVFLTPLLMIFCSLGSDAETDAFLDSNGDMLAFMDESAFPKVIALCVICVGSFVIRLIIDGSVAAAFKRRRLFTWGIIAADVVFLANGLFSSVYDIKNLGYGAFLAMGFTVVYFLVSGMIEKSDDPVTYACYAMLGTAYVAFLQLGVVVAEKYISGDLFIKYNPDIFGMGIIKIDKNVLTLGWGISTVICAVFTLGIPAAFYLAKNRKGSAFTYFSAVLFILGAILTSGRAAFVVGTITFIICAVVCCIKGKNRVYSRIYSGVLALMLIAAGIYVHFKVMPMNVFIDKLADILRIGNLNNIVEAGRQILWKNGIEDFLSSPVFGVGFNDGGYSDPLRQNNFFSNMYHCILIEIPAAMGICGCIAFLLHGYDLVRVFFKKFSVDKMLVMMVPLSILGLSLVDNFFFYLHFQIYYGAFIAVAEYVLTRSENGKSTLPLCQSQ